MSNRYNTDGMLVFPESETEPILNPLESIACAIAFDVRDWFEDRRSAWVYSIVFGLEDDTDIQVCRDRFHWDEDDFDRVNKLHAIYETLRNNLKGDTDDKR